jgi:hypothetical protein
MFKENSNVKNIITGDVVSIVFVDYRRCKGSWIFTMALVLNVVCYIYQFVWIYWTCVYKRVLIETKKYAMVIPRMGKLDKKL